MRTSIRSIGLALAAAGCAASLALTTATAAEAANKALMVNGMGAGNLSDIAMAAILNGMFKNYSRQNVPWPQQAGPVTGKTDMTLSQSVNVGADNLDVALTAALAQLQPGEKVTLVGLSAGALVVDEELKRLTAKSGAPDASKLDVVLVADSSRCLFNKNRYDKNLNYQYTTPVPTKYNTTVVTGQYDGYSDFPDRPNALAVANAIAGSQLVHIPSMLTDLSKVPASNVTKTTNALGGVTTSYLVPTPTLPLVMLNPKLKSKEAAMRKTIDAAYSRNTPKAAAAEKTAAAVSQRSGERASR
ncbi:MAG: PE-PPE domain-containing protein [Mycobacterium sp.]|nr:PE-PPE domain-containing protein [Mycobacterium sp.]